MEQNEDMNVSPAVFIRLSNKKFSEGVDEKSLLNITSSYNSA